MNKPATAILQQHFGLQFDPFAPDALSDFFFVGGQRRYLAQRVVHALYFSGGVVLLSGERGAGKSCVLDIVIDELGELTDSCRIEANVMMDGEQIRRLVATRLGLPAAAAQQITTLIAALVQWQPATHEPQPIALLIDDAHLLAVPVLTECLLLARSAGGRLRLLLAGEPELLTAWQQVGADAVECIELPRLDRQETADYVLTRLQAAGYREQAPLTEAQWRELYEQSRGNFAAIHQWLPMLLANVATASPRRFVRLTGMPKNLSLWQIGIAAAALAGMALLLITLRSGDHGGQSAPTEAASPRAVVEQRSIPLTLPSVAAPPIEQPAKVEPPKVVAPSSEPVVSAPMPTVKKVEPPAPPAPKPIVAAPPAPQPIVAEAAPVKALTEDERTLLAWPTDQYALQLLGGESTAAASKFVADRAGDAKLYAYRTLRKENPWNIVVIGPYANRDAALAAAAQLPSSLRVQKPWPRSVASIHADIRAPH